ncbi:hypothetical protein BN2537_89 [Streptomyces venezuelae]|nr:hypothetical protein BN2537_89 [Streptomyces venezuelae]
MLLGPPRISGSSVLEIPTRPALPLWNPVRAAARARAQRPAREAVTRAHP